MGVRKEIEKVETVDAKAIREKRGSIAGDRRWVARHVADSTNGALDEHLSERARESASGRIDDDVVVPAEIKAFRETSRVASNESNAFDARRLSVCDGVSHRDRRRFDAKDVSGVSRKEDREQTQPAVQVDEPGHGCAGSHERDELLQEEAIRLEEGSGALAQQEPVHTMMHVGPARAHVVRTRGHHQALE